MLVSTSNCFKDYKIARARVDYLHEKRNKERRTKFWQRARATCNLLSCYMKMHSF